MRYEAEVAFDPKALDQARVVVAVDVASLDTGDGQRNTIAASSQALDASGHPRARYESRSFEALGEERYEVRAALAIRGVTKEITHPVAIRLNGEEATAEGQISLLRTDWGIGQGQLAGPGLLGLEAAVRFRLYATRAGG